MSREDGSTGTVSESFGPPSDALPVIDGDFMFFGYQKGGLGAIDLKSGTLAFSDNLDGKLILTAFTAPCPWCHCVIPFLTSSFLGSGGR